MPYYIAPVSDEALAVGSSIDDSSTQNPRLAPSGSGNGSETDFLRIGGPEEIRFAHPAVPVGIRDHINPKSTFHSSLLTFHWRPPGRPDAYQSPARARTCRGAHPAA